jgi:hypothetical protein
MRLVDRRHPVEISASAEWPLAGLRGCRHRYPLPRYSTRSDRRPIGSPGFGPNPRVHVIAGLTVCGPYPGPQRQGYWDAAGNEPAAGGWVRLGPTRRRRCRDRVANDARQAGESFARGGVPVNVSAGRRLLIGDPVLNSSSVRTTRSAFGRSRPQNWVHCPP